MARGSPRSAAIPRPARRANPRAPFAAHSRPARRNLPPTLLTGRGKTPAKSPRASRGIRKPGTAAAPTETTAAPSPASANRPPTVPRARTANGNPALRRDAQRKPPSLNRDGNAPFSDRVLRRDGKPAFRRDSYGEGKPSFRRDSETRPPCKPKGSVRGAQPSGSQGFAANPPYRPWENTRKKSPRKPRNS